MLDGFAVNATMLGLDVAIVEVDVEDVMPGIQAEVMRTSARIMSNFFMYVSPYENINFSSIKFP